MAKPDIEVWRVNLSHVVSLMLMNVQSIKKARRFYALSCITSPGGKHRGLAGSVAVLIAESLLMLTSLYMWGVAQLRSVLNPHKICIPDANKM